MQVTKEEEHHVKSLNNPGVFARKQANYCKIYNNGHKLPLLPMSAANISHIYKNIYDLSYASPIVNEEV